ncbi:glycosyltransferase family 4 protein [uncultured Psychroserpens sp.]|uniref:glycosyltransferase family 4 protein n=1 Tax=uncultured Psychroserpens sp. TaxID=255436 RepID=UPI002621DB29|nr:glycosyltransferase family 4 protein [uncultured Psychroserpens sp.]
MSKQDKVLIVTSEFPPQPGGIGNHAFNLAKALQKHNFNVELISDQRSKENKEELDFDRQLQFKVYRIKLQAIRWLMYFKRLFLGFRRAKKNNTIIASGKFSLWIVAFYSLFLNRNFIAIVHGSEVNLENKLLKRTVNFALRRFDKIIAVSNYTKQLIDDLELSTVTVIPNGIDNTQLKKQVSNISLSGSPKLITVGNVTDRKGQLNVIKHIPKLIKIFPDIHYHIVGLPTQANAFLEIAKRLNVENYITFHGRVSNEELIQFLSSSDIFVMLSSETKEGDVEGFGIAIIEANYFGLPAIGALNCGIEDAINDNKSGRLINHDDSDAFIASIQVIMNDHKSYHENAKQWANQHDWNTIIEQYIKVIK